MQELCDKNSMANRNMNSSGFEVLKKSGNIQCAIAISKILHCN